MKNAHSVRPSPRRPLLAYIFYGVAIVMVIGALVLVAIRGAYVSASDVDPGGLLQSAGFSIFNVAMIAICLWAVGAVLSYLHGIRQSTQEMAAALRKDVAQHDRFDT